jgi:hypothetical protein
LVRIGGAASQFGGGMPSSDWLPVDVDFGARPVAYFGCNGEEYTEAYRSVDIDWVTIGPRSLSMSDFLCSQQLRMVFLDLTF